MRKSNEKESETNPTITKMLEELAKRIETGEKKIKENDKVETYNSRVDQIPGAPPTLNGPDSKKNCTKTFLPKCSSEADPQEVPYARDL